MRALINTHTHDADSLVKHMSTFLTVISAIFLIIFVIGKDAELMSFGLSNAVIIGIAAGSLIMALLQYYLSLLRDDEEEEANLGNNMNLSSVHDAINSMSSETDQRGASVLLKAASEKLLSGGEVNNKVDGLHQHIDRCASTYNVSGTYLLLKVLVQRFEHVIADGLINISSLIIRLGAVRLDYMEDDEKEHDHFKEMWLEDIELMPTVRRRMIFGLTRLSESFEIVCHHGILSKPIAKLRNIFNR